MIQRVVAGSIAALVGAGGVALVQAQRGGPEWTTSGSDAQRSGWMRADPRISVATMLKPGAFGPFKFLWKLKLEHDPKAPTALTQPVLLTNVVGFRGFKAIVYVATASQTIHAIDYDFGTPLWKYHINYTASPPPLVVGTPECPIGMTAAPSRPTAIVDSAQGGRGGGGRGGRSGGGVGEPGKGATTIALAGKGGPGGPPGPPPAAPAVGPGGAVPGSAAAAAGNQPGGLPGNAVALGGGGGGGGPFRPGADAAYVVGTDGYLHALNIQNGWDNMTPALYLPANTRAVGLIVATTDEGAVAYVATTRGCGSQSDAVWAMDLASPQKTVTAFSVLGATIVGSAGPAIGHDGTVYIATAAGTSALSNTLFSLTPKTLKLKAAAKVPNGNFTSTPLVFTWKDKDAVLVAGGGRVYLFESASFAAPLAVSPVLGGIEFEAGALASWIDLQGTRWVAAPTSRGITTFKLIEQDGKPMFQAGWTSPPIPSPLSPLVINTVMFAASAGTRQAPSVLNALEAATGKPLWNSGTTITTTVRGGLAGGQGSVYVPGSDGTLYAFGFDIEK
ncbi:MAG: PQQ-binding-like beta-propeller repeat protein [Vicinamibacterales bacterium]